MLCIIDVNPAVASCAAAVTRSSVRGDAGPNQPTSSAAGCACCRSRLAVRDRGCSGERRRGGPRGRAVGAGQHLVRGRGAHGGGRQRGRPGGAGRAAGVQALLHPLKSRQPQPSVSTKSAAAYGASRVMSGVIQATAVCRCTGCWMLSGIGRRRRRPAIRRPERETLAHEEWRGAAHKCSCSGEGESVLMHIQHPCNQLYTRGSACR